MEIPLRKGRFFTEDDTADKPQVVIIDEKFAQRFWPDSDPIGKHLWLRPQEAGHDCGSGGGRQAIRSGDGWQDRDLFSATATDRESRMFLAVRTSSEAAGLASAVVSEIHAVDPDVVVYGIQTMQDRLYDSLARQRFSSTMLGAFAVFALLLAAIGLYGVMSHLVTQGTHDIGVLVALGARPGNIIRLVVRQGMELAGIGIVVGLAAAAALTRVMSSLLFGVSATDVATFAAVPALLAAVAFAATAIPAWRATRVDPMVALREE